MPESQNPTAVSPEAAEAGPCDAEGIARVDAGDGYCETEYDAQCSVFEEFVEQAIRLLAGIAELHYESGPGFAELFEYGPEVLRKVQVLADIMGDVNGSIDTWRKLNSGIRCPLALSESCPRRLSYRRPQTPEWERKQAALWSFDRECRRFLARPIGGAERVARISQAAQDAMDFGLDVLMLDEPEGAGVVFHRSYETQHGHEVVLIDKSTGRAMLRRLNIQDGRRVYFNGLDATNPTEHVEGRHFAYEVREVLPRVRTLGTLLAALVRARTLGDERAI